MADFNISGILDTLTQNNNQRVAGIQQTVTQQAVDTATIQRMMTSNLATAEESIAQKTELAATKATLEARNQELAQRAQAIVGLNPDDVNNDFVKSVTKYNQFSEQANAATARVAEASSVGLLDNPVSWLFSQLELPSLERQALAANTQRDMAAKDIQARTAMLSQHRNSVIANTADEAKKYNLDLAQATAKDAVIKLREQELNMVSALSSRRMAEATLRDKIFDINENTLNKVLTVQELMDNRASRAANLAQISEERQMRIDKRTAEQAEIEVANLNLQRFSQLTGGQPVTVDMIKNLPKEQREFYGMVATTGALGASMGDVLFNLQSVPGALENIQASNPLLSTTVKNLSAGISSYMEAIRGRPGPDGKLPSEKRAITEAVETYQDEMLKSMGAVGFSKPLNSPHWDKQYNPYRADHKLMLNLVEQNKAPFLQKNLVTQTAQTIDGTLGGAEAFSGDNETQMLKSIAQRVAAKEVPAKVAARDIVAYYNAVAQIQRDQTQYGIFMLPAQSRYMVGFPDRDINDRQIKADLLNPTSVEAMLTNLAMNDKIKLEQMTRTQRFDGLGAPGAAGALIGKELVDAFRNWKSAPESETK